MTVWSLYILFCVIIFMFVSGVTQDLAAGGGVFLVLVLVAIVWGLPSYSNVVRKREVVVEKGLAGKYAATYFRLSSKRYRVWAKNKKGELYSIDGYEAYMSINRGKNPKAKTEEKIQSLFGVEISEGEQITELTLPDPHDVVKIKD